MVYMKKIYNQVVSFLTRFIYLQLFLTLVSLPILSSWGLPLSLLTFIGNVVFSPVLTLFLLLSSLLFFCALLHIPYGLFIWPLQQVTAFWLWSMRLISSNCYIGFPIMHPAILILLVVCVVGVLHCKYNTKPIHGISALLIIAMLFFGYCRIAHTAHEGSWTVLCQNKPVTLIQKGKTILVFEQRAFGRCVSLSSWLEYTLLTEITKKTGLTTIDHMVINSFNQRIFVALADTLEKLHIKNLYLPSWQRKNPHPLL